MANFPTEQVLKICVKCKIPEHHGEWLSGEKSKSTGATHRLDLIAEDARGDEKTKLSRDQTRCFLDKVKNERWYSEWRQWLVNNSKHKVIEEKLPPVPAIPITGADEELPCWQPSHEEADSFMDEIDQNYDEFAKEEKLRDKIEHVAKDSRRMLCPDWWEILLAEFEDIDELK